MIKAQHTPYPHHTEIACTIPLTLVLTICSVINFKYLKPKHKE